MRSELSSWIRLSLKSTFVGTQKTYVTNADMSIVTKDLSRHKSKCEEIFAFRRTMTSILSCVKVKFQLPMERK